MSHTRMLRSFGVAVSLVALLAACGNDGDDPVAAEDGAPGKAPSATVSDDTVVAIAGTDLGQVLVDADGFTLYAFLNDSPNSSACVDQCAQSWPPLTVDGDFEIGLNGAGFATTARVDGSTQLTVDGRPLYRFSGDQGPGETNGQGVNGKWFAVDPSGRLIDGSGAALDVDAASTDLGDVLVDADGYTLYAFLNDSPNTSACNDQCAQSWPPVTIDGSIRAGGGLTAVFGTTTRSDGGVQLTVAGRPLYRFSGDEASGETNGQGVNGKWFAVDPSGNLIQSGG
ncbi:MAG: hypothetical protein ACRD0A_04305 [Acidimicrobiales bacterium]